MEGLEIVGEAADGLEAVQQVEKLSPDVVLMDLVMREWMGLRRPGRSRIVTVSQRGGVENDDRKTQENPFVLRR